MAGSKQIDGLTPKQRMFLAAYRVCLQISRATRAAGCKSAQCHYTWLQRSESYCKAFYEVHNQAVDALESEAYRRAIDGERQLVLYKGQPAFVYMKNGEVVPKGTSGSELTALYKTEKSDMLLAMLLKAKKPEVYKDRTESTINASVTDNRAVLYLPTKNNEPIDDATIGLIASDHPASSGTAGEVPGE